MWNLKEEEIARKIQAAELEGILNKDLRVPDAAVALLLMDEKLDRVLGPGLVRVASGMAQFFGLGKRNAVVLARSHELTLDFPIKRILTKDPVFLDFNCQVVVKLQAGYEVLFLKNTMAGRNCLTFPDLSQSLAGEVKEVAQSYLGKRTIMELADHIEIKPGLEAEIELNLKRTLSSGGLVFLRLRTADFNCEAWDERKKAEILVTAEQAKLEGKKRLQEVFTQNELVELAEETRKAELYEKRIQLWDRMRRAAQSDKMNDVRSEQDFDNFLRGIDQDKLLKASEFEEFKLNLRDKLADRESTWEHLVQITKLNREHELRMRDLSLRSELTQAQQQAEAELQARRYEAELKELDTRIKIKKAEEDIAKVNLQIESEKTNSQRAQELSGAHHQAQMEDVHLAQESKKRMQEKLEKAEAEKLAMESRERQLQKELEWLRTIDTLDATTKVLVADTPQKIELLAGLAKIKAQSNLSTEQLLAMAMASGNSPQIADILKSMVNKATSLEERQLFEWRVSEQKEARNDMKIMSESFLKAQQELFNKTLETLAQISQNREKPKETGGNRT